MKRNKPGGSIPYVPMPEQQVNAYMKDGRYYFRTKDAYTDAASGKFWPNCTCEYDDYDWHMDLKIDCPVHGSCQVPKRPTFSDPVEHPPHYTSHPSGVEAITITEAFNFNVGNAVKYLWRAGLKGDALEDLRKAEWYVRREISRLEARDGNGRDVEI